MVWPCKPSAWAVCKVHVMFLICFILILSDGRLVLMSVTIYRSLDEMWWHYCSQAEQFLNLIQVLSHQFGSYQKAMRSIPEFPQLSRCWMWGTDDRHVRKETGEEKQHNGISGNTLTNQLEGTMLTAAVFIITTRQAETQRRHGSHPFAFYYSLLSGSRWNHLNFPFH